MTHTSLAAPLGTCDVALGERGGRGGPPLQVYEEVEAD